MSNESGDESQPVIFDRSLLTSLKAMGLVGDDNRPAQATLEGFESLRRCGGAPTATEMEQYVQARVDQALSDAGKFEASLLTSAQGPMVQIINNAAMAESERRAFDMASVAAAATESAARQQQPLHSGLNSVLEGLDRLKSTVRTTVKGENLPLREALNTIQGTLQQQQQNQPRRDTSQGAQLTSRARNLPVFR